MATRAANNEEITPVSLTVKIDIHEGQLEAFQRIWPGKIFKDVQDNDPGCTRYDWRISAEMARLVT
jgi:quinol monooxygenase YgiN